MPIDLHPYTSFKTHANATALFELHCRDQLPELSRQRQPLIVLGSGSNVLFADDYDGTVVVNRLMGREVLEEDTDTVRVKLSAGENWHNIVCEMSAKGYYGLENLALIPGTVGAAPVQNIGAYGVEIADFIDSVEVFDLQHQQIQTLERSACEFGYRDSIFKRPENRQRYVIIAVTLRLSRQFTPILTYRGLSGDDGETLTPKALLERVVAVRQSKLPDPEKLPNAGSFFKNPVIARTQLKTLQERYPDMPFFDIDADSVKVPAAWLLETAGFKGAQRDSGAGVYEKHALILINRGGAHGRDIYALAQEMMAGVKAQFGIEITPEVRLVGGDGLSCE